MGDSAWGHCDKSLWAVRVMLSPEEPTQTVGVETGTVSWAGEVLLPLCLATAAVPGGEIRGFMNLLRDIH